MGHKPPAPESPKPGRHVTWAYGVTTVPERIDGVFPRTLASLRAAGFDQPRIFVDGGTDGRPDPYWGFAPADLITVRNPRIRAFSHWALSLWELYARNPLCERYALFQDDFVTYRSLKRYLSGTQYPDGEGGRERGYWNLYTFPSNQTLCPPGQTGFYPSNQYGRGAVGLVFNRAAVMELLVSPHIVAKPTDPHRGWKCIDGAVVTALSAVGYRELVHNPSLVQHTGADSAIGNQPQQSAVSFRGEDFDALDLFG